MPMRVRSSVHRGGNATLVCLLVAPGPGALALARTLLRHCRPTKPNLTISRALHVLVLLVTRSTLAESKYTRVTWAPTTTAKSVHTKSKG